MDTELITLTTGARRSVFDITTGVALFETDASSETDLLA